MESQTEVNQQPPPATTQDFPIVGIGASAGGLDAFKRFLKAIPEDSGMAYVLVQHLDPTHSSMLPEILSRATKIPVNEITDDIHLAPDHIYVIPENKMLTSIDGVLKLTPRDKIKTNLSIDVFFKSLAEVHQSLAAGVVLSGTGSDGTLGLKAIKDHGGITFAQDQHSAAYNDMPQSAVNANVVDFVLAPEAIPEKLLQIIQTSSIRKSGGDGNNGNGTSLAKDDEMAFKQIILLLKQNKGVDFTFYKQTTIRRRIARRMAMARKEDLNNYLSLLRFDKAEQQALFNDVLIPVTSFFRDIKIFETLSSKIFPALLKNKSGNNSIRIWVAGCSTGEEAYSIAIALHEFLGEQFTGKQIQIFASDISEIAVKNARAGYYSKADMHNVSEERIKKHFTISNGGYLLNREIRDVCVFAVHNFLKDPPFAKMDLISCRNVLIYFDTYLQKKALTTFHYALKDSGFLLLGKSETTGLAQDLYSGLKGNEKIYMRKSVPVSFMQMASERKETAPVEKEKKVPGNQISPTDFRKNAEALMLAKYTPASVIVNEQLDIVHIHGHVVPFLAPSQGKPSFNLFKMTLEELAFELRNTLLKAKTANKPVAKDGIAVNIHGYAHEVRIEVVPLTNTVEPYYLILFQKTILPVIATTNKKTRTDQTANDVQAKRISKLEKELAQFHEDMHAITEDQEASNEELQSANEELLSGSEELQSLNEELETSKEELQSSNEELIIINQELIDKHQELNLSRLYTEAIIATVREPLVVLDAALRIKTVNIAFTKKFSITETEAEGKLFSEIQNHLFDNIQLGVLLEQVLSPKTEINDYEVVINLLPFGLRTMLINARHLVSERNKDKLILLAIEDISERKLAGDQLKTFSDNLELKVKERTASLEQSHEQLEQFAHTASHELQEPLRKITTFSQKLQKNFKEGNQEDLGKYLDKIETSSSRLTKLVSDMMSFTSISFSNQLFKKTDLNELFKHILSDFELVISEKKAKIKGDHLPVIEAIPFQMNQVLYDIMGNALKFTRSNVLPEISITSHEMSKKEVQENYHLNQNLDYYEIIFKDNGIGFDQKYANKIFVMFQRLVAGNTYAGTGMGMALSKKIIENHQGQIFAEGVENEGATFHIILPVKQPIL